MACACAHVHTRTHRPVPTERADVVVLLEVCMPCMPGLARSHVCTCRFVHVQARTASGALIFSYANDLEALHWLTSDEHEVLHEDGKPMPDAYIPLSASTIRSISDAVVDAVMEDGHVDEYQYPNVDPDANVSMRFTLLR